jgi:hypothetical protein
MSVVAQGGWKLLWDSGQSPVQEAVSQRPRIFSPPLQQISFPTRLLRQAPARPHPLVDTSNVSACGILIFQFVLCVKSLLIIRQTNMTNRTTGSFTMMSFKNEYNFSI